jgi:hypothetical protein
MYVVYIEYTQNNMTDEEREKRRIKAREYYAKNRELVLEKFKYGIYQHQTPEKRQSYYSKNKNKILFIQKNKKQDIIYTMDMLNNVEIPERPKREKKKPKSSLQRKQERIIKQLNEVERRAEEFRRKLAEQGIPEYPNPIVEGEY